MRRIFSLCLTNTAKMNIERSFTFEELEIDPKEIITTLGYTEDSFFEPFPTYLAQAFECCKQLNDIKGAYRILKMDEFCSDEKKVCVKNLQFNVGRTIRKELNGAENIAFFVCTAGAEISQLADKLLKGEDPVLGYVYDVIGSAIAEAVGDKIQEAISLSEHEAGRKITNRYSPGYCHWNVTDQHKLFSIFGGTVCDVKLTPSALMHPVKSISGLIGIGEKVEFHDYQCNLCQLENCVYRDKH